MSDIDKPPLSAAPSSEQLKAALLSSAQGDKVAFARLYSAISSKLFGVILRIHNNRSVAEEILQEVFINIWNHAADYDPSRAEPMAWLCTIARNRTLDFLRRAQITDELTEDMEAVIESPDAGPAELYLAGQNARALSQCLGQLESRQREAINLAYFSDLSHGELAERLTLPLGTVKTWIRRGLDKLRTCLGRTL